MTDEWRVLLPEGIDHTGPKSIRDFATCTSMNEYESIESALDDIGQYDAVIVRVAELDAGVISAADRLKVISKHGAGLDNVDISAATNDGIVVCNTPGANARSVAEHVITLLLAVNRKILPANDHVRNGGWERAAYAGHELAGDTLGLFGCGSIARETAKLALGLGLSVLTYDPYIPAEVIPEGVDRVQSAQDVFEHADAVSIHVPLTDETRQSVSHSELKALGSSGVLVNTSRGQVVDEVALTEALESGTVAGAGLDVFESEPPTSDNPLFSRDDVVVTPHIGGVTDAALQRMSQQAAANVRTVREGGLPASTVNEEVFR
jgi:D-3-phosphoglycerate dehydrogenase